MADIDRIREALQFIDASSRDKWVSMGMAIKSEVGDTGFDVWELWSQQSESFNAKDARDVWKSIRAGGKVTIGTLFYEARRTAGAMTDCTRSRHSKCLPSGGASRRNGQHRKKQR